MSSLGNIEIPPTLLRNIERAPIEYPVALLLRHSIREEFVAGDIGNNIPITEDGKKIAIEFGRFLGERLKTLHSSPLLRCVQTAEALREGAGVEADISGNRVLGDPGVFVVNAALAWSNWESLGNEGVMRHLAAEDYALPGMANPEEASQKLVRYMLSSMNGVPGLHVFVTHDVILAPTAARFLRQRYEASEGPAFLEGALFWEGQLGMHISYRECDHCAAYQNESPPTGV